MGRVYEDIRKLTEEQLKYDEGSKEYTDIQIQIRKIEKMVTRYNFSVSYVEEDAGFSITRGTDTYSVYGTCEGTYSYYHADGKMYMANGDPGYPEETEIDQLSFKCWVDEIQHDGEPVDITLTDTEREDFESYMSNKLDDVACEYEREDPYEFEIDEEDW